MMKYFHWALILICAFGALWLFAKLGKYISELPARRAGKEAEKYASGVLKKVLKEGDFLITNPKISFEGKRTELDNVIVNGNGVFVVEVKYYSGELKGEEDDYEWEKYHLSRGGKTYAKKAKNPIRQVKRQVYILANYLREKGLNVWVEGYVLMLGAKSPVESGMIISDLESFGKVIHSPGKKPLDMKSVSAVRNSLR